VGWVSAGRYQPAIERLKFSQSVSTPTILQMAVAEYLDSGAYDRHLRFLRTALHGQVQRYRTAIATSFPCGTRISEPKGGFVLWVELPSEVSSLSLQTDALARGIAIAPGCIFGARQRFSSAIRVTCGAPWSPRMEQAITTLGELAHAQLGTSNKLVAAALPSPGWGRQVASPVRRAARA